MNSESLTAKDTEEKLRTRRFGRPLAVYGIVDSTNDIARELAKHGAPEGAAVLAREQTGGRGRQGRGWVSPAGGLWLSVVLRPSLPADAWPLIGFAAGAGAAAAVEAATGATILLKWPNDLMLHGRKVGGILVESGGDVAILGIGINANVPLEALPDGVRAGATTLLASLGRPVELAALARTVLYEVEQYYDLVHQNPDAVLEAWRARSFLTGRRVTVSGAQRIDGVAEGIDVSGALLVRTGSGIQPVRAADVSVREADPA